jgi:hypothetical protein
MDSINEKMERVFESICKDVKGTKERFPEGIKDQLFKDVKDILQVIHNEEPKFCGCDKCITRLEVSISSNLDHNHKALARFFIYKKYMEDKINGK